MNPDLPLSSVRDMAVSGGMSWREMTMTNGSVPCSMLTAGSSRSRRFDLRGSTCLVKAAVERSAAWG